MAKTLSHQSRTCGPAFIYSFVYRASKRGVRSKQGFSDSFGLSACQTADNYNNSSWLNERKIANFWMRKGLFTRAIWCLTIDILDYVFYWRERRGQTTAIHKRISCCIDSHELITYTNMVYVINPFSGNFLGGLHLTSKIVWRWTE